MAPIKILIIRFSSFGDIVQAMGTLDALKSTFPGASVDWVCRSDMAAVIEGHPLVTKIWSYERKTGLKGLWELAAKLRQQNYTHIYDAHCNLRSRLLRFLLFRFPKLVVRSKERWRRFLLFKLRINHFPRPYKGMHSYLAPLAAWGVPELPGSYHFSGPEKLMNQVASLVPKDAVALVPSAAWPLKRWPLGHWKKLVTLLPDQKFVVLGGPADDFCQELEDIDPSRVVNLAGKLSLQESCLAIERVSFCLSADTGLLHIADINGTPAIALLGPTAFGFPSHSHIHLAQVELECRPCTKDGSGGCHQAVYQKCMVDITPEMVAQMFYQLKV